MASDPLKFTPESHNFPVPIFPNSASKFNAVLLADTDTTLTVPTGCRFALIQASKGIDFYLAKDTVITLPSNNTFASTSLEHNPDAVFVEGIVTLHFRATNAIEIVVQFFV